jgi:hypothetical protein
VNWRIHFLPVLAWPDSVITARGGWRDFYGRGLLRVAV